MQATFQTVGSLTTGAIGAVGALVKEPLVFASGFFANSSAIPPTTALGLRKEADRILAYLTFSEAVRFSSCSTFTSNAIIVPRSVIQRYLDSCSLGRLGECSVSVSSSLSLGNVRRLVYSLRKTRQLFVSIDPATGHIIFDAGSAFATRAAFQSAQIVPFIPAIDSSSSSSSRKSPFSNGAGSAGPGSSGSSTTADDDDDLDDGQPILKQLEVASYDEYDDFHPRHPNPRTLTETGGKTHRRGDSYFNSDLDIEALAQEALQGIQTLDLLALDAELRNSAAERERGGGGGGGGDDVPLGMPRSLSKSSNSSDRSASPSHRPGGGRKSRVTERLGIVTGGRCGDAQSSDEEEEEQQQQKGKP